MSCLNLPSLFLQSRGGDGVSEVCEASRLHTPLQLCCCRPEPAFHTRLSETHVRGKAVSWTVSPSAGHRETHTFTSIHVLTINLFLLVPCLYSHTLVCRVLGLYPCALFLPHYLLIRTWNKTLIWLKGPIERLTLTLIFSLPIFYFMHHRHVVATVQVQLFRSDSLIYFFGLFCF